RGVDLGAIKIIEYADAIASSNRSVGRMLVGPCCITTSIVDYAKDGVRANKLPWIDRGTSFGGIAIKFFRINRSDATISKARTGSSAIQFRLVQINSFFVFGCVTRGGRERLARRCRIAIAGSKFGTIE